MDNFDESTIYFLNQARNPAKASNGICENCELLHTEQKYISAMFDSFLLPMHTPRKRNF